MLTGSAGSYRIQNINNKGTDTVEIKSCDDAQVVEGYPDENYGTAAYFYIQSADSGSYKNERGWMKFNLNGQIPNDATIKKASLFLYLWKADGPDMLVSLYGSDDDDWSEHTINWNNQPTYETLLAGKTLIQDQDGIWIEFVITDFTKLNWNSDKKISLLLKANEEGSSETKTFAFDAKEWSGGDYAPYINIEYDAGSSGQDPFKVFHFNDIHSRLLTHDLDVPELNDIPIFEEVGGAAYFTTELLDLKNNDPDSLILVAGDIFEGGLLGDLRKGGGTMDFLNLLDQKLESQSGQGIDAICIGNHDIRDEQYMINMKNNAEFPMISMNICHEGTNDPFFDPFVISHVNNNKVGILGYTTTESDKLAPDAEAYLDLVKCSWDGYGADIAIRDYVHDLRVNHDCDIIIFLPHIGHSAIVCGDNPLLEDDGYTRPPDLVIAGHWHSYTKTVWQPYILNDKTLIAEAASYLQYIGEVQLDSHGDYMSADKYVIRGNTPNSDVQDLINQLKDEYNDLDPEYDLEEIIGYSSVDLIMDKDKWWTLNEYPWGGDSTAGFWVCDSMQDKLKRQGYLCDLAIQAGGGIRRDTKAGSITYREIYETYPWDDDEMVLFDFTGQQIWNYLESEHLNPTVSKDWLITADDGKIESIYYKNNPIGLGQNYHVTVSEYMIENDADGYFAHVSPIFTGLSIRDSIVDYTKRSTKFNKFNVPTPRYIQNTEFSGIFKAVVTMINEDQSQPFYECAFIRLLEATPETVARRGTYVPEDLVNYDGSINQDHQFIESMLYRSHLGIPPGYLKKGDIIELRVEASSHGFNPQFVEQEGISSDGVHIKKLGYDPYLAIPEEKPSIDSFWNEEHENHYVKFSAIKLMQTKVRDDEGTEIRIYDEGGFYSRSLPGEVGERLELTGCMTQNYEDRVFRCDSVKIKTDYEAPEAPTILGSDTGSVNSEISYDVVSKDPEGNNIYYYLDWGDGHHTGWDGPYNSNEKITYYHTYQKEGAYIIRAKAKDIFDHESDWGIKTVSMPKNKIYELKMMIIRILSNIFKDFNFEKNFL